MLKLKRTQKMVFIALFAAITLVLALTPLGFIPLPGTPLTIVIMVLPIIIGGSLVGLPAGTVLGLIFGLVSFFRAPTEALGVIMLGQSAFASFVSCVVPRLLVGLWADFCGLALSKKPALRKPWFYALGAFGASILNTVLFLGSIVLFFDMRQTGIGFAVFGTLIATNGLPEAIGNTILTVILMQVLTKSAVKKNMQK